MRRVDYGTIFAEWIPLAERGNADAQYRIGMMYEEGRGVTQDYAEAMKWYRLAAEQGVADAQYNIGVMWTKIIRAFRISLFMPPRKIFIKVIV